MNSSGGLLLVAGLVVLWLLAKGYGKNIGPAWTTLVGSPSGAQVGLTPQPTGWAGAPPTPVPTGGLPAGGF